MISFVRTVSVAPGKMGEALKFAHDIVDYFKKNFETELSVAMPIGGNPNRIAWITRYDGLAELESMMGKMMADADYNAMVAKNSGLFIAGSINDEIWRYL